MTHPAVFGRAVPYVAEAIFNAAGAVVGTGATDLITVPAETLVLHVEAKVTKANTQGGSGTIAIGDGGSAARYAAAATVAATGFMTATGTKNFFSAAGVLRATVATASVNATVAVKAVMVDMATR